MSGLSCFAELAAGDHGYDHALFGITCYFGGNKSLIQRHREDDPPNLLRRALYTIGTYGAQFNHDAERYVTAHAGSVSGSPPPSWTDYSYGFSLTAAP